MEQGRCLEGTTAPHPSKVSNNRGAMGGEEPSSPLQLLARSRKMNVASCLGRRGGRTLCRAPAIGGSKGRGLLASRSCCSPAGGLLTMERGHRGGARAHGAGEGAGLGAGLRKKGLGAMERKGVELPALCLLQP